MLMEANYMDVVLFRYLDHFINIILINSKFAQWTPSYNMMSLSSSYFGINPDKDLLSSKFILEKIKCFEGPYVNFNSFF